MTFLLIKKNPWKHLNIPDNIGHWTIVLLQTLTNTADLILWAEWARHKKNTMHTSVSHLTPYLSSCALLASILRMLLSAKGQPDRLKKYISPTLVTVETTTAFTNTNNKKISNHSSIYSKVCTDACIFNANHEAKVHW